MNKFEDLLGKIITSIDINDDKDKIIFTLHSGKRCILYHSQDCCESVSIEDIEGDINDLLGHPILLADEVTSYENPEGIEKDYQESFTWTFYKLATIAGSVTIRWYGQSNGYYSESVYFEEMVE